MFRSTLEPRYFERMAAATAEKTELIPHLVAGTVVDVGAGGGELAQRMMAEPRIDRVFAIDNSLDSVRRLQQIPVIDTIYGSTERLAEISEHAPINNIVFSSVIHEIFSYAPAGTWHQTVDTALQRAIDALAPGGRLLIRDFVLPERADERAVLITPDDAADGLIYDYLERTPFADLRELDELDEHMFLGTRRSVSEALLTINWGPESLPREAQERYGLYTLELARELVLSLSEYLTCLTAVAQIQPGYREHLAGYQCVDPDGSTWFPDTKALWVFEKKG